MPTADLACQALLNRRSPTQAGVAGVAFSLCRRRREFSLVALRCAWGPRPALRLRLRSAWACLPRWRCRAVVSFRPAVQGAMAVQGAATHWKSARRKPREGVHAQRRRRPASLMRGHPQHATQCSGPTARRWRTRRPTASGGGGPLRAAAAAHCERRACLRAGRRPCMLGPTAAPSPAHTLKTRHPAPSPAHPAWQALRPGRASP